MLVWSLGVLVGAVVTYAVTWYFYRRGKADTRGLEKRLEEVILKAILPNLTTGEAAQRPEDLDKAQPSAVTEEALVRSAMDKPQDVRNRILQQVADGELYAPEVLLLARIFTKVGEDIAEISPFWSKIAEAALHGQDTTDLQARLDKRIQEMLEEK